MNFKNGNILLFILLITSVVMLPLLMGVSIVDLPQEEEDMTEDDDLSILSNFSAAWIRIPVHQLSILLRAGLSIFTLFVVYLGGRSKHRRFNDRTIDHIRVLMATYLKTARIRAVFDFNFCRPMEVYLAQNISELAFLSYPNF